MSTPSLLIVPARLKAGSTNFGTPGILYSQIPTNGDGDFRLQRDGLFQTRYNDQGLVERVGSSLLSNVIPRLDYYTSSGTPGCPALLVEPSGTNLALQSEGFSVSGTWVPEGTNPTQVTANSTGTLDPAGGNTADIITLVSGSANQLRQSFVSTSGTTYTVSVFLKNIALTSGQTFLFSTTNQEATVNQVNCTIDLANLTITAVTVGTGVTVSNAALDNYGNGWYRARFTFSFAVGGTNSYIRLRQPNNVGTNYAFYAWGAQLETGSVATSYIPTATAQRTRNADVISVSGAVSGSIGQTEGTIYTEVDVRNISGLKAIIQLDNGTGDNRLLIQLSSPNTLTFFTTNGGSVSTIATGTITTGTHKIAASYSSGTVQIYMDGLFLASGNTTNYPSLALNNVSIGSRIFSGVQGNFFNDRIRAAALYTTRLSDADLMLLTMPGNDTYLPQAVWNNYLSRAGNTEVPDCLYTRHADLLDV